MYEIPELKNARSLRPGTEDPIYRWRDCKDCGGWGWRNRRPFAPFNRDPVQCPTCEKAYRENEASSNTPNALLLNNKEEI